MEEELAREKISEQKKLAREEGKLKREIEKEHRILQKVTQDYQVMWLKKAGRRLACMNLGVQIHYHFG